LIFKVSNENRQKNEGKHTELLPDESAEKSHMKQ